MLALCRSLRVLTIAAASATKKGTSLMGKKNYYAVASGRRPGVYSSWEQCREQVDGFRGNRYKGFGSSEEALQYLASHGVEVTRAEQPAAAAAAGVAAAPAGTGVAAAPAGAAAVTGGGAQAGAAATCLAAANSKPKRKRGPQQAAVAADGPGAAAAGDVQPKRRRPVQPVAAAAAEAAEARQAPALASGQLPASTVLRLEFDGACKRNPGPSGFGALLYDDATGAEVARVCCYMGDHHTNNQAEYAGLIAGLHAALELGCRSIRVQGDSTLIIKQVLGQWQVKHEGLRPYAAAAQALRARFASFRAQQVPRERNTAADALSNQAIARYRSGADTRVWRLEDVQGRGAGVAAGSGLQQRSEAGSSEACG